MGLFDKFFKKNNKGENNNNNNNVEQNNVQDQNQTPAPSNSLIEEMTPENSVPLKPGQNLTVGTEDVSFNINAPQFNSVEEIEKQFPEAEEPVKPEEPNFENFKPEVPTAPVQTEAAPLEQPAVEPQSIAPVNTEAPKVDEGPIFGDPVDQNTNTNEPQTSIVEQSQPSPIRLFNPDLPRQILDQNLQAAQSQTPAQNNQTPIHLVGQEPKVEPAPGAPLFGDPEPIIKNEPEMLQPTPVAPSADAVPHFPGVDQTDFNGERLDGVSPQTK